MRGGDKTLVTLLEFMAPLTGSPYRDKCLALLYYKHRYEQVESLTADQIRSAFKSARVPGVKNMNIADVLAKSGQYVDSPGALASRRLWRLTDSGADLVRKLLNLPSAEPEIEHDVAALRDAISGIRDIDVKEYLEESVKCLEVGLLRPAIVFLWSGAIRTVEREILTKDINRVSAALLKHDPKARHVARVEDFEYIKDKTTLLAAEELGLHDKGQRSTLQEALDLRNRCGHPTNYKPGIKKASSFVEDVMGIIFPK